MASKKGGMCARPFGGHESLNKFDFAFMGDGSHSPEQLIVLSSIADALRSYLYFGLGPNKITADEFWFSCQYLFQIRSDRPESWRRARILEETYVDEQTRRRATHRLTLSDAQLRGMCFDQQYQLCRFPWSLDYIIARLKATRRAILEASAEQVQAYLLELAEQNLQEVPHGATLHFQFARERWLNILVEPEEDDLRELLFWHYDPPVVTEPAPKPDWPAFLAALDEPQILPPPETWFELGNAL
jgi:hypothetical protein